jgi:integrase
MGTAHGQTLNEFTAAYFRVKGHSLAANTIRNREDDYLRRIEPDLGRLELTQVTRERVEIWLAGLAARATSRRMIHQSVATLRVILATAVEWGRRPDNPAAKLRLPITNVDAPAAERVLTREQLVSLVAASGTLRTETLIRAAGEAGLRRGELAGLRWPDVDLECRRLHIRRQIVQERLTGGGHNKVETPTKGKRARRSLRHLRQGWRTGSPRAPSRVARLPTDMSGPAVRVSDPCTTARRLVRWNVLATALVSWTARGAPW